MTGESFRLLLCRVVAVVGLSWLGLSVVGWLLLRRSSFQSVIFQRLGGFSASDGRRIVSRNRQLLASFEIPTNNTFRPLVLGDSPDFLVDLFALLPFVTKKLFRDRAQRFSEATAGLLKSELPRAQSYGFCRQPLNWVSWFELSYQLDSAIPASYFAHLHGCLNSTHAYNGSYPFYFFSPAHHIHDLRVEVPSRDVNLYVPEDPYRILWNNLTEAEHKRHWNLFRTRHHARYGVVWPPFKKFYGSPFLVPLSPVRKPIAVVAGKYAIEWGGPPINTFAEPDKLAPIIESLTNHSHLVIYNRTVKMFAGDTPIKVRSPREHQYLRDTFPGRVLIAQDLLEIIKVLSDYPDEEEDELWNILQFVLYACSSTFIATQGGNSNVASLFGGVEFILHKKGGEALGKYKPPIPDDYIYQWWGSHSGAQVHAYGSHEELYRNLEAYLSEQSAADLSM